LRRRRHEGLLCRLRRARPLRRLLGRGRADQCRVRGEDPLVELLQFGAGLHPQLVAENPPGPPVGLQCVRAAAGLAAGQHQLTMKPLPQRLVGRQFHQLIDGGSVAAELQPGIYPGLQRVQPELRELGDLGRAQQRRGHVRERGTAPQRQRGRELVGRRLPVPGGHRLMPAPDLLREKLQVQVSGGHLKQVAGGGGLDAAGHLLIKLRPQPHHVVVQRVDRGGRRIGAPHDADQAVGGHQLVGAEQQASQHVSDHWRADRRQCAIALQNDGSQQTETHQRSPIRGNRAQITANV
jgi:hypothetical protein